MNAPAPNPIEEAAVSYGRRGYPIFPCDPDPDKRRAKRPLIGAERGPDGQPVPGTGWLAKATTDERTIRSWWRRWPDALIGCIPGRIGAFVVDLDPRDEPIEAVWSRLERAVGSIPPCAETVTQSGGRHLWFRHPPGEWGNTSLGLANIDIRCDAGYVILPPSTLQNGRSYAWARSTAFDPDTAPDVPARLLTLIEARKMGSLRERPAIQAEVPDGPTSTAGQAARRRYATKALDEITGEAARASPGERGRKLYRAACQLGRFLACGDISDREARAALLDAADRNGLLVDDGLRSVERDISRGLAEGSTDGDAVADRLDRIAREAELRRDARPIGGQPTAPRPSDGGQVGRRGGAGRDDDDGELARLPRTDLGNAERFARRNKGRLIFVPALGWLAWDGRRWKRDGAEEAKLMAAHETARLIQAEATAIRGTMHDAELSPARYGKDAVHLSDALAAWGRVSESASRLRSMPDHAAPYLTVPIDRLDADPWCFNVRNGTLRFVRGETERDRIVLRPHDPSDLITKLAPVDFDPTAEAPTYDRFLAEVQPRGEMRRFLHQWAGYSLTGDTAEQKLCFFYGKGKNGKSTLVDAWGHIAGDYGGGIPVESFMDQGRGRNAGAATPDLAALPGVRFLLSSEPEKGSKLAEALIKAATGGEPMQVRHLNRDYFSFRPAFKLTMSGNYRPRISGTDEGIWRRLAPVPWLVTVANPDRGLGDKLAAEASGILNRMLDGLRDYLDNGMAWPGEVVEATRQYREDSDPLGRFLAECVEPSKGSRVQSTRLHDVYAAWCRAAGEAPWTVKGLSGAMKDRGYTLIRSNQSWWTDIRLILSERDLESADRSNEPEEPDDSS